MGLSSPEALYLGTDNEPADQSEVFRWLAKAAGNASSQRRTKSSGNWERLQEQQALPEFPPAAIRLFLPLPNVPRRVRGDSGRNGASYSLDRKATTERVLFRARALCCFSRIELRQREVVREYLRRKVPRRALTSVQLRKASPKIRRSRRGTA